MPLQNITITVPEGSSNHGNPNLLCIPIKWYQILIFFAANYFSHAATVRSAPGQKWFLVAQDVVAALILPYSGVMRAVETYWCWSWPSDNNLLKAARAGALCTVVRNKDWVPKIHARGQAMQRTLLGMEVCQDGLKTETADSSTAKTRSQSTTNPKFVLGQSITISKRFDRVDYRKVHGNCSLPHGYELAFLPANAKVNADDTTNKAKTEISSSYNIPKAMIAIAQTIYASITLYHTRGDQIQQYGYASFGLTVIPYIIMSIMNLSCSMILPDYPALYLVHSLELEEARAAGGEIDGMVGYLDQSPNTLESLVLGRSGLFEMDDSGKLGFRFDEHENSDPHKSGDGTSASDPEIATSGVSNHTNSPVMDDKKLVTWDISVPSCAHFKTTGANRSNRLLQRVINVQIALCLLGPLPYVIILVLTYFDPGLSTRAQRAWIMTWLTTGVYCGVTFRNPFILYTNVRHKIFDQVGTLLFYLIPAIGGFVVVGQMLQAYGSCFET